MSVAYLDNNEIKELIANGKVFQKSALTSLRKPKDTELNTELTTYVSDNGTIRKESLSVITDKVVLARNLIPLKETSEGLIYNEWPIPLETAIKNYGQEVIDNLTHTYTNHKKKAILKGIELTQEVLNILGVTGDILEIKVSWSEEPMLAKIGDTITDGGYSVSKNDMKDYELVA